MAEMSIFSSEK